MNLLVFLSVLLWVYILYSWIKWFLNKESKWYIFFRVLFIFIILNYISYIVYWLVTSLKIEETLWSLDVLWLTMIVVLPILWASIWIGLLWKYLFGFIKNSVFIGNNWWILKKVLLFILSLFFIIAISYWPVIWLTMFFSIIQNWTVYWTWLVLWWGMLVWFSWLWVWIWYWLMMSWLLIYIEKLLSKEWIKTSKKILYIILNILFYILLYNLITLSLIYSIIALFWLLEMWTLDFSLYIKSWLTLWIIWIIVAILQWYIFFIYHKKGWKILFSIIYFILLQLILLSWIYYHFNLVN